MDRECLHTQARGSALRTRRAHACVRRPHELLAAAASQQSADCLQVRTLRTARVDRTPRFGGGPRSPLRRCWWRCRAGATTAARSAASSSCRRCGAHRTSHARSPRARNDGRWPLPHVQVLAGSGECVVFLVSACGVSADAAWDDGRTRMPHAYPRLAHRGPGLTHLCAQRCTRPSRVRWKVCARCY
jgi:hypothetical protein